MRNLLEQVNAKPQNHPTTTFIYGLVDPITGYVRYVGKADYPKDRFKAHLRPSQLLEESHKTHWLRSLIEAGKKPSLIILEKVPQKDWECAEKKWIAYFRSLPNFPPLTNTCPGGEGFQSGFVVSEETRRKHAERMRGKKMPPGTGEKIRQYHKGRPKTASHRAHCSDGQRERWKNATAETRDKMLLNLRTPWSDEKRDRRSKCARSVERRTDATSQYRNVVRLKNARGEKVWRANCVMNGKLKTIGLFYTEVEAAQARDRFVLEHIGKDVPLNFPLAYYEENPIAPPADNRKRQSKMPKNNTIGYKGVYKNGKNGWAASINYMNVSYHLGTHRTPEQAALAYDAKAIELFGEFAKTNFPRASCSDISVSPPQS